MEAENQKAFFEQLIETMLDELVDLVKQGNKWGAKHGYPLLEKYPQYPRVRAIGREFAAIGGFVMMQRVCEGLQRKLAATPRANQDINLVIYGWAEIEGWEV